MNSDQIRVTPETKKEIIRLMPIYSKGLIEEGKETQKIEKILKEGISQGEFIEVLVDYWKEKETKKK